MANIVLKDICPSIKWVIVTAEVCTKEDRSIIEKGFGVWWLGTLLKLKDKNLADDLYFEKWYIGSKDIKDKELLEKSNKYAGNKIK